MTGTLNAFHETAEGWERALHRSLASLSLRAHQLAAEGVPEAKRLRKIEGDIDRLAAQLWGLTEPELEEIQHTLEAQGQEASL